MEGGISAATPAAAAAAAEEEEDTVRASPVCVPVSLRLCLRVCLYPCSRFFCLRGACGSLEERAESLPVLCVTA